MSQLAQILLERELAIFHKIPSRRSKSGFLVVVALEGGCSVNIAYLDGRLTAGYSEITTATVDPELGGADCSGQI